MAEKANPVTIGSDTRIKLGFLFAIVGAIVTPLVTACGFLWSINDRLGRLEETVHVSWTLADQVDFEEQVRLSGVQLPGKQGEVSFNIWAANRGSSSKK